MKVTIKNPVAFYCDQNYSQSLMEFAMIIQDIATARDENEIRANLDYSLKIGRINNFKYGFGGSHMWVKQLSEDRKETKQLVILVNYEN